MMIESKLTVKQARLIAEKTQRQIAESIGVCLHTYMKLEKDPGTMTLRQAKAFCEQVSRKMDDIRFFA